MISEIVEKLKDNNIAILGFGLEGKSTYRFIRKYLGNVQLTIIDGKDKSNDEICKNDSNLDFIYGETYLDNLDKYDIIIKTPGISLKDINVDSIKDKITSQLELLLEVNRKNIIGITGTKGKSTTSSLIYNVMKEQDIDVVLAGNIGVPVLDEIENYKEDTKIVIEMSSHQLEFIKTSPHIAVILNLFQDHLDHAGTLEHYHNNKMNIFKYQTEDDIALYSIDNDYINQKMNEYNYKAVKYDISKDKEATSTNSIRIIKDSIYMSDKLLYVDGKRNLIGDHYLVDIAFVVTIAKLLDLNLDKAKETICNFEPLPYRLQKVGTFNDITYYVDTIATVPEATIAAVESISNIDTLIFGGEDRHTDYSHFVDFLKKCPIRNLICMYGTGARIKNDLNDCGKNIYYFDSLREAVNLAKQITTPGTICLLSPAASSKDYFVDYQEKGKLFVCLVKGENTDITERK